MTRDDSIALQVSVSGPDGNVPAGYLALVIATVNDAVAASERSELQLMRGEIPQIPVVAFDAATHRLQAYKEGALTFRSARSGSIILVGAVAGTAIWVLQQTVGETLKEAWLDSESHHALKAFLSKRRSVRVEKLGEDAVARLRKKIPCEASVETVLQDEAASRRPSIKINVDIKPPQPLPPVTDDTPNK